MRSGIVIAGPTGVGKTDLAVRLAEHFCLRDVRCEIVSADAVSIYRELEIGTAKPSADDRRRVRHHLIDIRSIDDSPTFYSAGKFSEDFFNLAPSLPDPILICGGTGFYIDAIIRGLAPNPPASPLLRRRLMQEETQNPGTIFEKLRLLDPASAKSIGESNLQRLIRAVEVCELTGRPFSEGVRRLTGFQPLVAVLSMDRSELYKRIDERARGMFTRGLVDEVRELLKRYSPDLPAFSTVGYSEAVRVATGRMSEADAIEKTAQRTRNLAKRQLTWWRHFRYERVVFVRPDVSAAEIAAMWKEKNFCGDS